MGKGGAGKKGSSKGSGKGKGKGKRSSSKGYKTNGSELAGICNSLFEKNDVRRSDGSVQTVTGLGRADVTSKKSCKTLTRKELRKQARTEKKERANHHLKNAVEFRRNNVSKKSGPSSSNSKNSAKKKGGCSESDEDDDSESDSEAEGTSSKNTNVGKGRGKKSRKQLEDEESISGSSSDGEMPVGKMSVAKAHREAPPKSSSKAPDSKDSKSSSKAKSKAESSDSKSRTHDSKLAQDLEEMEYYADLLGLSDEKNKRKLEKEMAMDGLDFALLDGEEGVMPDFDEEEGADEDSGAKANSDSKGKKMSLKGAKAMDSWLDGIIALGGKKSTSKDAKEKKPTTSTKPSKESEEKPKSRSLADLEKEAKKRGNLGAGSDESSSEEAESDDSEGNDSGSEETKTKFGKPIADSLSAAAEADRQELAYLEEKLGLSDKKARKKLKKESELDGMDMGLLDMCDQILGGGKSKSKKALESDESELSDMADEEETDTEEYSVPDEPIDLEQVLRERGHLLKDGDEELEDIGTISDDEKKPDRKTKLALIRTKAEKEEDLDELEEESDLLEEEDLDELEEEDLSDFENMGGLASLFGGGASDLFGGGSDFEEEETDDLDVDSDDEEEEDSENPKNNSNSNGNCTIEELPSDEDTETLRAQAKKDTARENGDKHAEEDADRELKRRKRDKASIKPVVVREEKEEESARPAGAYVPPSVRRRMEADAAAKKEATTPSAVESDQDNQSKLKVVTAELEKMKIKLRGHLNKLSEGNLNAVATDICVSLREMRQLILNLNLTTHNIGNGKEEREKLLKTTAAYFADTLIACAADNNTFISVLVIACYAAVAAAAGARVDAMFLKSVIVKLEDRVRTFIGKAHGFAGKSSVTADELQQLTAQTKNCCVILCLLFDLGATPTAVPFGIFKGLFDFYEEQNDTTTSNLNYGLECCLDLALVTLRYSGKRLRGEFPADFKAVLQYLLGNKIVKKHAERSSKNVDVLNSDLPSASKRAVLGATTDLTSVSSKSDRESTNFGSSFTLTEAATASRLDFLTQELADLKNNKVGSKSGFAVMDRFIQTKHWFEECELLSGGKREALYADFGQAGAIPWEFLSSSNQTERENWILALDNLDPTASSNLDSNVNAILPTSSSSFSPATPVSEEAALYKLAKEQRMTSEQRRHIFAALQGSADDVHAVRRLHDLKPVNGNLKLKIADVANVVMHCALRDEKVQNPFYSLVIIQLCSGLSMAGSSLSGGKAGSAQSGASSLAKKYTHAFRNAFIPRLQEVQKYATQAIMNLAFLFATAAGDEGVDMPLGLLRYLDFQGEAVAKSKAEDGDSKAVVTPVSAKAAFKGRHGLFLREVLLQLLGLLGSDSSASNVDFSGLDRVFAPLKQYEDLASGLRLALKELVMPKLLQDLKNNQKNLKKKANKREVKEVELAILKAENVEQILLGSEFDEEI